MNTAVQQAIIDLKIQADILFQEGAFMTAMNVSLAAKIVERYLQIEKEQIIDAYRIASINNAPNEDMQNIKPEYWQVNAELWYNKHYNQNK